MDDSCSLHLSSAGILVMMVIHVSYTPTRDTKLHTRWYELDPGSDDRTAQTS